MDLLTLTVLMGEWPVLHMIAVEPEPEEKSYWWAHSPCYQRAIEQAGTNESINKALAKFHFQGAREVPFRDICFCCNARFL